MAQPVQQPRLALEGAARVLALKTRLPYAVVLEKTEYAQKYLDRLKNVTVSSRRSAE
jgi:hypothetical protein